MKRTYRPEDEPAKRMRHYISHAAMWGMMLLLVACGLANVSIGFWYLVIK